MCGEKEVSIVVSYPSLISTAASIALFFSSAKFSHKEVGITYG